MAITTKATYFAPDIFDNGSRSHFTVTADLSTESALEAFVKAVSTVATIVELGDASSGTAMRFSVENNGVTAAELATITGETVADFAY